MVTYRTTEHHEQFLELPPLTVKIIQGKNPAPGSRWHRIPGYAIYLICHSGPFLPGIVEMMEKWYLEHRINKYPSRFKRYKLPVGV